MTGLVPVRLTPLQKFPRTRCLPGDLRDVLLSGRLSLVQRHINSCAAGPDSCQGIVHRSPHARHEGRIGQGHSHFRLISKARYRRVRGHRGIVVGCQIRRHLAIGLGHRDLVGCVGVELQQVRIQGRILGILRDPERSM